MGLIFDYFLWGGDRMPPSKIGLNWTGKVLKTVLESSEKMREGISKTSNPENAVNPGKNGRFVKCLVMFKFFDAFYTIRVTHLLTLNAYCGSCIWDIDTIQVLSCVLLP